MIRILPVAIELILLVFCLIDCIQAPDHRVRNLPKWGWIILMVLLPIIGSIAWLVAGRPLRDSGERKVPWPTTQTAGFPEYERPVKRPLAPDDDPEFLAKLKQSNAEHERLLKRWEEDLKRREDEMRKEDDKGSTPEQP